MNRQNGQNPPGPGAHERLLEAGMRLFAEQGYAATTVREIVEEAGVTKPVLYYYFESKAGIFRAILDRAVRIQETLLNEVVETDGTALDRFILLYQCVYQGVSEHPDLFRMIHNLLFGPSESIPCYDYDRFHRRMLQAVEAIYAEGVRRQEVVVADPEEVGMLVLGLMDFCLRQDRFVAGPPDSSRAERLLRLAFCGLARKTGRPGVVQANTAEISG